MVELDGGGSVLNGATPSSLGDSEYQGASKLHYWFKSDGDLDECVGCACWSSCIRKGLRLQPAQQTCIL